MGFLSSLFGSRAESPAPQSRFVPGQVWLLAPIPGQPGARLTILRVEDGGKLGAIVHVAIHGLSYGRGQTSIQHLPFAESAVAQSVAKRERDSGPVPDFTDGYQNWREAFDAGRGGIFTIPVGEAVIQVTSAIPAQSPPDDAETPEFKALLDGSMEGLRLQTASHQNVWHFGEAQRWDFFQDTGELIFTFPDRIVRAPAQIIGTFSGSSQTWMWSWANSSIENALTRDASRVRAYGEEHGLRRLTEAQWSGDEQHAWMMTALACRLCEANGAYRGPAGSTFVFFTFGEVQIVPRT